MATTITATLALWRQNEMAIRDGKRNLLLLFVRADEFGPKEN
jgi:hypothetical protein